MLRITKSTAAWALAILIALPTAGFGQDILAGHDLFETDPGTTWLGFSYQPIPADFFEPGSDPFDGVIAFAGNPLGSHPACPNDDLSLVDTIVER